MANGWIPFYFGDYLADTSDLSLAEHGAYLLLMAHYYSTGKPLDAHASVLHRVCRCTDDAERAAVAKVIQRFFVMQVDSYHQKRIDQELVRSFEMKEKRKKAADIRWGNDDACADANGHAHAMQVDMQVDTHSHSHSQEEQDQKLLSKPKNGFDVDGFASEVFEYYRRKFNRNEVLYTLTPKRKAMFLARMKEVWKSLAEPKRDNAVSMSKYAIDQLAKSPYHNGQNDQKKKYVEWEHIFRSQEQFQKWVNQ